MIKSLLVILIAILGLSGCAQIQTVPPGKEFSGNYINVKAPETKGWQLIGSNNLGMTFAKHGETRKDSFIAMVNMFHLEPTRTPKEFETLMKKKAEEDADPSRFEVQQQSLKYSSERPYPCIRYKSVVKDKKPQNSSSPLLLEIDALYCRHPIRQDTGFAAIYSYRGTSRYPDLHNEAETFIQGIQVPGK